MPDFANDSYREISTYSNKDSYMAILYSRQIFEEDQSLFEVDGLQFKLNFKLNTMTLNNFQKFSCSGGHGVIQLQGMPRMNFEGEIFSQGGDSSKELISYQSSSAFSKSDSLPHIIDMMTLNTERSQYLCQGIYKIKRSNWILVRNQTVSEFFLVELNNVTFGIDSGRSNIINFQDFYGTLTLDRFNWTSIVGINQPFVKDSILGYIITSDKRYLGTTFPLIWFQKQDRAKIIIDNTMLEDGTQWSRSTLNSFSFVDLDNKFNSRPLPAFNDPSGIEIVYFSLQRFIMKDFQCHWCNHPFFLLSSASSDTISIKEVEITQVGGLTGNVMTLQPSSIFHIQTCKPYLNKLDEITIPKVLVKNFTFNKVQFSYGDGRIFNLMYKSLGENKNFREEIEPDQINATQIEISDIFDSGYLSSGSHGGFIKVAIDTLRMSLSNIVISNVNNPIPQYQNVSGALIYIEKAGELIVDRLQVRNINQMIGMCPDCNGKIIYYNSVSPLNLTIMNSEISCNSSSDFLLYNQKQQEQIGQGNWTQGSVIFVRSFNSQLNFKAISNLFQYCSVAENGAAIRIHAGSPKTQNDIQLIGNTFTQNYALKGGALFCEYCNLTVFLNNVFSTNYALAGGDVYISNPINSNVAISCSKHQNSSTYADGPGTFTLLNVDDEETVPSKTLTFAFDCDQQAQNSEYRIQDSTSYTAGAIYIRASTIITLLNIRLENQSFARIKGSLLKLENILTEEEASQNNLALNLSILNLMYYNSYQGDRPSIISVSKIYHSCFLDISDSRFMVGDQGGTDTRGVFGLHARELNQVETLRTTFYQQFTKHNGSVFYMTGKSNNLKMTESSISFCMASNTGGFAYIKGEGKQILSSLGTYMDTSQVRIGKSILAHVEGPIVELNFLEGASVYSSYLISYGIITLSATEHISIIMDDIMVVRTLGWNPGAFISAQSGGTLLLQANSSKFSGSEGYASGGLLYLVSQTHSEIYFEACSFQDITSWNNGGSIFSRALGTQNITIKDSIVSNNLAWGLGGFAYLQVSGNTIFRSDSSKLDGFNAIVNGTLLYFESLLGQSSGQAQVLLSFSKSLLQLSQFQFTDQAYYYSQVTNSLNTGNTRKPSVFSFANGLQVTFNSFNNSYQNFYTSENGSYFMLNDQIVFRDKGSRFSSNAAMFGGAIYCSSCKVELDSTEITNMLASKGGVIFARGSFDISLKDVKISSSKALEQGGSIYLVKGDESTSKASFKILGQSTRVKASESVGSGGFIFSNHSLLSLEIQFLQGSGFNSALHSGFIDIANIKEISLNELILANMSAPKGALMFSTLQNLEFTLSNSVVSCSFEPQNMSSLVQFYQSSAPKFNGSLIQLENSKSVTSINNIFKNCQGAQKGSIFNLQSIAQFQDQASTFNNNSAYYGGVAELILCDSAQFDSSTFADNFAIYGGTMRQSQNTSILLNDLWVQSSSAQFDGGFIYSYETIQQSSYSSLTIDGILSMLCNCKAIQGNGGCFYINEKEFIFTIVTDTQLKNLSAFGAGAFIYSKDSKVIMLQNVNANTMTSSTEGGRLIYSEGAQTDISLRKLTLVCNDQTSQRDLRSVLDNYFIQGSVFQIVNNQIAVQASDLNVKNCQQALQGSVFNLQNSHLETRDSIYENNEAKQGGITYCMSCSIKEDNISLSNNSAIDGGYLYVNSSGQVSIKNLQSEKQFAYTKGSLIDFEDENQFGQSSSSIKIFGNISISKGYAINGGGSIYLNGSNVLFKLDPQEQSIDDGKSTASFKDLGSPYFDISDGGFINVQKAQGVYLSNFDIENVQVLGSSRGSFLYSNSENSLIAINNVSINCNTSLRVREETQMIKGGALCLENIAQDIYISNLQVQNCQNTIFGGAISAFNSSIILKDSNISRNDAFYGGAIYCSECKLSFENVRFKQNSAWHGGSLYILQNEIVLKFCNVEIDDSLAYGMDARGGSIYLSKFSSLSDQAYELQNISIYNSSSENLGGSIYIDYFNLDITIQRVKIELSEAQIGGAFYFQGLKHVRFGTTSSYKDFQANIAGSLIFSQVYYAVYQFTDLNISQFGENIGSKYFASSIDIKNAERIEFIRVSFSDGYSNSIGGVFKVIDTKIVSIFDSYFSKLRSQVGGAFGYFRNTEVQILSSQFNNIKGNQGSSFFIEDFGKVQIHNSSFIDIQTSQGGGIISATRSDQNQIDDDLQSQDLLYDIEIKDCVFKTLSSDTIGAGFFFNSEILNNVILANVSFQNIQSRGQGGLFHVKNMRNMIKFHTLQPDSFNLFEDFKTPYEEKSQASLFYSTSSALTLFLSSTIVDCQIPRDEDFERAEIQYGKYAGAFHIENAKLIQTQQSIFKNCYQAHQGSIFSLVQSKYQDSGSQFTSNSAIKGGVFILINSIITLDISSLNMNFAHQGGVFYALDNSTISIQQSKIENNIGFSKGGVLFQSNNDVSNFDESNFIVSSSKIFNNSAIAGEGGFAFFDSQISNLKLLSSHLTYHSAFLRGGFVSALRMHKLELIGSTLTDISSIDSVLIYSQSLNLQLYINNTQIACSRKDENEIQQDYETNLSGSSVQFTSERSAFYIHQAQRVSILKSKFSKCGTQSQGGVFQVAYSQFEDEGSEYSLNSAVLGGTLSLIDSSATFKNSRFFNNLAYNTGVIFATAQTSLKIQDSKFYKNKATSETGVIYLESGSTADISGSQIYENSADANSFMSVLSSSTTQSVTLRNTEVYSNTARQNTLQLLVGDMTISACQFTNNFALESSKNIFIGFSKLVIYQSTFQWNKKSLDRERDQTFGSYIYSILDVDIQIKNSYFLNGFSQYGGAISVSGETNLKIFGSYFISNRASQSGGSIYATGFSSILIAERTSFKNNQAGDGGDDLHFSNSIDLVTLNEVDFVNPNAVLSIKAERVNLNLEKVEMRNISTLRNDQLHGSALLCSSCTFVTIKECLFMNIKGKIGGAIYLTETTQDKQTQNQQEYKYLIQNSKFINLEGLAGGAIYLDNTQNVLIQNCTFTNNSALFSKTSFKLQEAGSGGAIYFDCLNTDNNCWLEIKNSQFRQNFASKQGGAIHWEQIEPNILDQVKFDENIALTYGDDISCFPQRVAKLNDSVYSSILQKFGKYQSEDARRFLLEASDTLQEQRSGGKIPKFQLALVDKYGQIVTTDSSSKLKVGIDSRFATDYSSLQFFPILDGSTQFEFEYGVVETTEITFTATPGNSYSVTFTSDGIDNSKPSNRQYQQSQFSNEEGAFQVQINLRNCLVGEQYTNAGQCETCQAGTSYSLTLMNSPGSCVSCPTEKALCNGGSQIGPKPGFWRSSNASSNFINCKYFYACLGMIEPKFDPIGECLEGYQGILCSDCVIGYSRTQEFKCSKCPESTLNIVRLILIGLVAIAFIIFLVFSTLNGAKSQKNVTNIFLKILMNHFQLIFITASFSLSWPTLVVDFFNSIKPAATVSTQIFSFDCFADTRRENYSKSHDDDYKRIYFIKLALFAVTPVIFVAIAALFWNIYHKIRGLYESPKNKITSTVVILLFLVHPTLTQYMLSNFDCIQIDSEKRLLSDMVILCEDNPYLSFTYFIAIPSLIVWVFGIPGFALSLLVKNNQKLQTLSMRQQLGFLYRGYRRETFYWEIYIIVRKIVLVFVQIFLSASGTIAQALIVLFLLAFSLTLNLYTRPFATSDLNNLESLSLVCQIITIYCGIFFLQNVSPKVVQSLPSLESKALMLSQEVLLLLFSVIVLANIMFFGYWALKMSHEIRYRLIEKIPKLYLFLFSCNNIERFRRTQLEIQINDENQYLRERFTRIIRNLLTLDTADGVVLSDKKLEKLEVYFEESKLIALLSGVQKMKKKKTKEEKAHLLQKLTSKESIQEKKKKYRRKIPMTKISSKKQLTLKEINEMKDEIFKFQEMDLSSLKSGQAQIHQEVSFVTEELDDYVSDINQNIDKVNSIEGQKNINFKRIQSNISKSHHKNDKPIKDQRSLQLTKQQRSLRGEQEDDKFDYGKLNTEYLTPIRESNYSSQRILNSPPENSKRTLFKSKSRKQSLLKKRQDESLHLSHYDDIGLNNYQDDSYEQDRNRSCQNINNLNEEDSLDSEQDFSQSSFANKIGTPQIVTFIDQED